MIKIFGLLLISIFCSSCAAFEAYDYLITAPPTSVNYAYKFDDKREPKIKVGMSKNEVINLWGGPNSTWQSTSKNYDEQWSYSKVLSEKGGIYDLGKALDFYLYFKGDTLKRITKIYYHRQ